MKHLCGIFFAIILSLTLVSCSVNPFRTDNTLTGTATGTAIGAGAGVGTAWIAGASKVEMAAAGVVGGALGYYFSSLPFASGGVSHVGGQVYAVGDYVTIEIPSDILFDVNSADFLPEASPVLDSAVTVLERYPNNNIMVSGNTAGFYPNKPELKISESRARQVSAYLWAHGISNYKQRDSNIGSLKDQNAYLRKLIYTGYGDYFPISNRITAEGVRQNSRIQITSYPSHTQLHIDKRHRVFSNIGSLDDDDLVKPDNEPAEGTAFTSSTRLPENQIEPGDDFKSNNQIYAAAPAPPEGYSPVNSDLKGEMWDSYNKVISADQTTPGCRTPKQGGADFKGERATG